MRNGDEVIIHSMDRLAKTLDDLRQLVRGLTQRDISVHFVKENLIFKGDDAPMSRLSHLKLIDFLMAKRLTSSFSKKKCSNE